MTLFHRIRGPYCSLTKLVMYTCMIRAKTKCTGCVTKYKEPQSVYLDLQKSLNCMRRSLSTSATIVTGVSASSVTRLI